MPTPDLVNALVQATRDRPQLEELHRVDQERLGTILRKSFQSMEQRRCEIAVRISGFRWGSASHRGDGCCRCCSFERESLTQARWLGRLNESCPIRECSAPSPRSQPVQATPVLSRDKTRTRQQHARPSFRQRRKRERSGSEPQGWGRFPK